MRKRLLKLIALLLLTSAAGFAQDRTVSGTVRAKDGSPMPGVNIMLKGTGIGTTTDTEGAYKITVPSAESVLVISFIGNATQELTVGNRTSVDVTLEDDATQLGEVVVTALGVEREAKTLVYATQAVKTSTLTEVRDANNVLNSLQGKVANAIVTQGSGGVGSGAKIVLRGNRSLQGSNNALIVVDGVPITNITTNVLVSNNTNTATQNDFGSVQNSDGASNINPDDIESMTILRGASAAALYGSQAGNGVIVITTKKGNKDKPTITLNSGITSETAFALPSVQNEYGQGNAGAINVGVGDSWGAKMNGQAYTTYQGKPGTYSAQPDNIKDFFRTGLSLNNSLGISGGSEKMQSYLSYTNSKVQGIVPKNDLTRHIVNARFSNQFSKKFSTDVKITYLNQSISNRPRTGEENAPVIDLYQIPRSVSLSEAQQIEEVNNVGVPEPSAWPSTLNSIYQNPYWMINKTAINETRDRVIGFVNAKYQITDWLSVKGRANLDKTFNQGSEQYSEGTLLWASQKGGYFSKTNTTITQRWYDVILEGNNKISQNLKINYMAGAIFQDLKVDQTQSIANGLNVANKFSLGYATNSSSNPAFVQTQTQSVFAQATLALKESLFLDASIRNEWDSRLPSPYTITYPSVGLSGIISDMVTLPSAISFVKLSANYAKVGNGGQPQIRNAVYNYSQGAGNGLLARTDTYPIANLKPEIVKNVELGLDARFINNRVGFTLTYYKSNSTNQLLKLKVPVAVGYTYQYLNAGNIQNQGIELVLTGTPIKTQNLTWDVAFNLGINRNKIISLNENQKIAYLSDGGNARSATPVVQEGGRYGDLLAFKWQKDANGNYVVDADGLPVSTADQQYIGNFNPKAILGLTNTFSYKKFSLRVLTDGRIGGTVVSATEMNLAFSGIPEVTAKHREDAWVLGGVDTDGKKVDKAITAQQFWQTASSKRYGIGEFFAYDATNFRVREISLGYDLPVPANFFIRSAKISVVARNLFWLYRGSSKMDIPGLGKRKMSFDPDMSLGNGNFQGIQYGTLPSTRSVGLNLKLTF